MPCEILLNLRLKIDEHPMHDTKKGKLMKNLIKLKRKTYT